jgi:hypothetical protein
MENFSLFYRINQTDAAWKKQNPQPPFEAVCGSYADGNYRREIHFRIHSSIIWIR